MTSKMILFLIAIGFGFQAHAAVTDVFDCKLAIDSGDGAETVSQTNRVALIRKPEATSDGYRRFRGDARITLITKANGVVREANVNFVIRHANHVSSGEGGIAFQSACFSPSTFFCDQPECRENPQGSTCTPGSPEKYGTRVDVIDGLPSIDPNQFRDSELHFGSGPQDGMAKASCTYVGTYR